ncbi:F510_1955 family glycosylhydrolase [Streptomyces longwoodensis]|uniref:F510_1955 family glycosylhydrolase n=1 Tax=Streptomyces longwoodensis TaxID=68231 RepID=UPI0033EE9B55
MNKRHAAAAATAATLSLTLAACSSEPSEGSSTSALTHIHGLGLAGGQLYIATHEGVYSPGTNGKPVLVGTSKDDFMGFTVARGTTFYASGHPSQGGNKGLIVSTDAGKTWSSLSLSGQSDFHALDYVDGSLYAYDATNGLLRTSRDGRTWKSGATLQALDIAVNPSDPALVLATTEGGVARSTDGGRTFLRSQPPVMTFLSWKAKDALYGIDISGGLNRSSDSGATWKKVSSVPGGQPQALTAVNAEHVLVASQKGVYESKDGGKTFTRRMTVAGGDG